MPDETIFEFQQTFSRSNVAEYLRMIAEKLDEGSIEFTAGGESTTVSVPEEVEFEVEVERDSHDDGSAEMELEFELEWQEEQDNTNDGLTIE